MFGIGGFLRLKIFEVVRKYPAYPIALCWTKCIQSHVIPIPIRSFRFAFGNNILECLYYKKTFALHSFHVELLRMVPPRRAGKFAGRSWSRSYILNLWLLTGRYTFRVFWSDQSFGQSHPRQRHVWWSDITIAISMVGDADDRRQHLRWNEGWGLWWIIKAKS